MPHPLTLTFWNGLNSHIKHRCCSRVQSYFIINEKRRAERENEGEAFRADAEYLWKAVISCTLCWVFWSFQCFSAEDFWWWWNPASGKNKNTWTHQCEGCIWNIFFFLRISIALKCWKRQFYSDFVHQITWKLGRFLKVPDSFNNTCQNKTK